MKKILFSTVALAAVAGFCAAAWAGESGLDEDTTKSLREATDSGDASRIKRATKRAMKKHPEHRDEIRALTGNSGPRHLKKDMKDKKKAHHRHKKGWHLKGWVGDSLANGNASRNRAEGGLNLSYKGKKFTYNLEAQARRIRENSSQSDEEYRAVENLSYRLGKNGFHVYGEGGYVNDPNSGFDHRLSMVVGLGHTLYKGDGLYLKGRLGVGGRHIKEDTLPRHTGSAGIVKPELMFKWHLWEKVSLRETLSAEVGTDRTIGRSETSLSRPLTCNLTAHLVLDAERTTKAPAGFRENDVFTGVKMSYRFF